jgi:hypothetical protein
MKIIGFTWVKNEHNILKYSSFYVYSNNKDYIAPLLTILIRGGVTMKSLCIGKCSYWLKTFLNEDYQIYLAKK